MTLRDTQEAHAALLTAGAVMLGLGLGRMIAIVVLAAAVGVVLPPPLRFAPEE